MKNTKYKQTEIGEIPEDWSLELIGHLPIGIGDGNYSSKYPKKDELLDKGVPFISGKDIKDGRIVEDGIRYISEAQHNTLLKGHIKYRDVLLVTRADIGVVGYVDKKYEGSNINAQLVYLRSDDKLLNPEYLFYLLSSGEYKNVLRSYSSGSAQSQLPIKSLLKVPIKFPHHKQQQQIASILSSLDDKIELNRKMNKTLEEMGKALFKRWFVDFEFPNENGKPYKSSGGEMVESELGMIPKGWEVGVLDNITEIKNGFAFKSEDYTDNGVFLLRTRNFTQSGYVVKDEVIYLPEPFYEEYSNYQLRQFDVLLVMVGASVGSLGFVTSNALPALQNQNMWNFRARDPKNQLYIKLLVEKLVKQNIGSASGSARDFFRKDFFRTIRFVCPKVQILNT
ncbi:MAG TPA: restriction endonuclease subunit S, partial [bacterium]|nr:restriction endonuclease subunit S [bacterium]